ncbi:MAG TPA: hypothetical protein VGM05_11485 [Planctomycetaceae bacterium]|jgi:hypothetical protein
MADTKQKQSKRIMARFVPQAWIGDYAVEIDGAYEFDVTEQILSKSKAEALSIEDDGCESDNLWHEHPVSHEKPHHGPFVVRVQGAILAYYYGETNRETNQA